MRRSSAILAVLVGLALSAPGWAALPFGHLDGKPTGGNAGGGVIGLTGWALDDNGVYQVAILVDGVEIGQAIYHRARPGVTRKYPSYPDSRLPGFAYQLDTTRFLNGLHNVSALVRSVQAGEVAALNTITLQFTNSTHTLTPFGKIEFPRTQDEEWGKCVTSSSYPRRWAIVSGYSLDPSAEVNNEGQGYVELMLDGVILYNSLTDCTYVSSLGGLVDCYGLLRLDIATQFPSMKNAVHSGFRFAVDTGALIEYGFATRGSHRFTIRSGDVAGTVADIDDVVVTFNCTEDVANEEAIGSIDYPNPALLYADAVIASGWALDREGVDHVEIFIDGVYQGNANYGLARADISANYPGFPNSAAPGWQFGLNTHNTSNGQHYLQAISVDLQGGRTVLGQTPFTVDNEP